MRSSCRRGVEAATIARIRAGGVNFSPSAGTPRAQALELTRALERSVVAGARPALLFAAAVVTLGALLSLLIPNRGPVPAVRDVVAVEPGAVAVAVELLG